MDYTLVDPLSTTTRRTLVICGWCGPLTVVVAFIGWLIAGVLPFPLGAGDSTQTVAAFYANGVRVPMGIALASIGICLVIPLVAGVGFVMWRMEGRSPILALIQLVSGAVTGVLLLIPMLIMAVAGFRPDRDAELTMMLNDLAWLLFLTPVAPFIIQNLAIGAGILTATTPLLPRWLGYLNFWVGFTFAFDVLAFAFKTGPFAWHGIFIFWLALSSYTVWLFAMGLTLRHLALSGRWAPKNEEIAA
ncbi:MAG: hypothetical protein WAW17_12840 [Rhodococcus sp. (in: high G+C Gram-positive bacteria)]|uniref:hypothetical protein n=1 Tax=Rhodococcus sp. TaxID=1831 RepID=UPI003BB14436